MVKIAKFGSLNICLFSYTLTIRHRSCASMPVESSQNWTSYFDIAFFQISWEIMQWNGQKGRRFSSYRWSLTKTTHKFTPETGAHSFRYFLPQIRTPNPFVELNLNTYTFIAVDSLQWHLHTSRVSSQGHRIRVVFLCVCVWTLSRLNRLTYNLDFWFGSWPWP